ncbi:hypothetical protein J5N97_015303 [Dioscorea zingiberensis]|uniref:Uncharacterized protein n=1 Tax=Dioscorea zingiberensis TaxID=325984 RepID=A0A9D5CVT8_9LILI|nr:hypothetical protein J5N97_015303 [Dioscorea zingiberensis]
MAASGAMPPLKDLVSWVWEKFQNPQEGEGEIISLLRDRTEFAIQQLNNIKARVEELKIKKIEPRVDSAEFAIEEREVAALKMGMVEIKCMAKTFAKSVDDLEKEVDESVKELKKRTVTILEKFPDSLKKKKKRPSFFIGRAFKTQISSNLDLVDFVTDHLKSSIKTLRFVTAIKYSLQQARKAELLVLEATVHFDHRDHKAALEKLRKFMEEGNPFKEEFIKEFQLVIEGQNSSLKDLRDRKKKLDRKLRKVETWHKVRKIVHYAAYAAVC